MHLNKLIWSALTTNLVAQPVTSKLANLMSKVRFPTVRNLLIDKLCQFLTSSISLYFNFHWHKVLMFDYSCRWWAAWPGGYRLRTVPQRFQVQIPDKPPVTLLLQRPIYLDCACRLQWATIRCGKHVHAGYMSLNMKLSPCFWTCCQYGTQSKSLCSVLHTPN